MVARQLQTVRIFIRDDNISRGGVLGHGGSHDSDRPRAGDQDILAQHRERQRGMDGVAEGIENRGDIQIDSRLVPPQISDGHGDVIGKSAGAIHAHAQDMRAQMPPPRQTITAASANHVSFAARPDRPRGNR